MMNPYQRIYFKKNVSFKNSNNKKNELVNYDKFFKYGSNLLLKDITYESDVVNNFNNTNNSDFISTQDISVDITDRKTINTILDENLLTYEDEILYFCTLYDKLYELMIQLLIFDDIDNFSNDNNFISKCISSNYNPNKIDINLNSMKIIFIRLINDLNFFILKNSKKIDKSFSELENKNILFFSFREYVYHFRKLFISIRDSYKNYDSLKKDKFISLLVKLIQYYQDLNYIYNNLNYKKNNLFDLSFSNINNTNLKDSNKENTINFIPIIGNGNVKSFFMSENCLSYKQFLNFVDSGEYFKDKFWSTDGLMWKSYFNITCPLNWNNYNGAWFINGKSIETIYNYPVKNICYYEAEAISNYFNCRLPSEFEWNYVSSNRNKTLNPNGLYISNNISCDFLDENEVDKGNKSLIGLNNLYGNVWEFTSTIRKNVDSEIEVCLKGGDSDTPKFILNNNLRLFLTKINRNMKTGLRLVKLSNQ